MSFKFSRRGTRVQRKPHVCESEPQPWPLPGPPTPPPVEAWIAIHQTDCDVQTCTYEGPVPVQKIATRHYRADFQSNEGLTIRAEWRWDLYPSQAFYLTSPDFASGGQFGGQVLAEWDGIGSHSEANTWDGPWCSVGVDEFAIQVNDGG